jgi:hypothetical protein
MLQVRVSRIMPETDVINFYDSGELVLILKGSGKSVNSNQFWGSDNTEWMTETTRFTIC